jgi:hypothetical protein
MRGRNEAKRETYFIPAFVNKIVGSFIGKLGDEGT